MPGSVHARDSHAHIWDLITAIRSQVDRCHMETFGAFDQIGKIQAHAELLALFDSLEPKIESLSAIIETISSITPRKQLSAYLLSTEKLMKRNGSELREWASSLNEQDRAIMRMVLQSRNIGQQHLASQPESSQQGQQRVEAAAGSGSSRGGPSPQQSQQLSQPASAEQSDKEMLNEIHAQVQTIVTTLRQFLNRRFEDRSLNEQMGMYTEMRPRMQSLEERIQSLFSVIYSKESIFPEWPAQRIYQVKNGLKSSRAWLHDIRTTLDTWHDNLSDADKVLLNLFR